MPVRRKFRARKFDRRRKILSSPGMIRPCCQSGAFSTAPMIEHEDRMPLLKAHIRRTVKIVGIRISGETMKKRDGRPGFSSKIKPNQSIPVRKPHFDSLTHRRKPR